MDAGQLPGVLEHVAQRLAVHVLHDPGQPLLERGEPVDLHDVRMLERGGATRVPLQLPEAVLVLRELGRRPDQHHRSCRGLALFKSEHRARASAREQRPRCAIGRDVSSHAGAAVYCAARTPRNRPDACPLALCPGVIPSANGSTATLQAECHEVVPTPTSHHQQHRARVPGRDQRLPEGRPVSPVPTLFSRTMRSPRSRPNCSAWLPGRTPETASVPREGVEPEPEPVPGEARPPAVGRTPRGERDGEPVPVRRERQERDRRLGRDSRADAPGTRPRPGPRLRPSSATTSPGCTPACAAGLPGSTDSTTTPSLRSHPSRRASARRQVDRVDAHPRRPHLPEAA